MTSRVVLHAGPAAGFDEPFEMLVACHDRVRRSLDLLRRLHAHVLQHGADTQAREAAADVLRYFDRAGPAHHEDEERHILPRLRADLAARLHRDHREMTRLWAALREPLLAWTQGASATMDGALLLAYADLYQSHMRLEEGQAFSIARSTIDEPELSSMGAEMAGRRITPSEEAPPR